MSTDAAVTAARVGQVTVAGRVRAGDALFDGKQFVIIERVRRAQGRKPAHGENLHVVVADDEGPLKLNSLDPVQIRRRPDR